MFEPNTLSTLELRRRLLLAESELNRLTLGQDLHELREKTRWLGELRTATPSAATPWLNLAAPTAGLLAAGTLLKRGTMFGRISGLLKIVAVAYPLVRAWHRQRHPPRQ